MGGTKPIVEGIRQWCLKGNSQRPFNYECLVYNDKQRKLGTYYIKINKLTNKMFVEMVYLNMIFC
jgi:hypothetical protein